MFRKTKTAQYALGLCALTLCAACEDEKKEEKTEATAEPAPSAAPAAAPAPEPAPSAEEPKNMEPPQWVEDYAEALCKRVATCREKMLAAAPPQAKAMMAMQMPTQEACLKNTRTFETAPKAELDDKEKEALKSCIESVPRTACGNVQTGKVPECQTIVDLLAPKKTE